MSKAEEIAEAISEAIGDKFGVTTPKLYCPDKFENKVSIGILEKVDENKSAKRFTITIDDHAPDSNSIKEVSDFVLNLEQWEELDKSQSAIIKSIIEVEEIKPFKKSSSLHIYEERYVVDEDTFRFTSAIDKPDHVTIDKLILKKK